MTTTLQTISKEQLQNKMKGSSTFQLLNVLRPEKYTLGIIPGSIKIPLAELDQRFGELDKSKDVVTYCRAYDCHASREAAEKLAAKGFTVAAYEGGIEEWKDAGLAVEMPGMTEQREAASMDRPSGLSGLP